MDAKKQIEDLWTVLKNPSSPEAQAILQAEAKKRATKIAHQAVRLDARADRMTREAVGKEFRVKGRNGMTYFGTISKCERAGDSGNYKAFKIWLKSGEYENGPFIVTALPR